MMKTVSTGIVQTGIVFVTVITEASGAPRIWGIAVAVIPPLAVRHRVMAALLPAARHQAMAVLPLVVLLRVVLLEVLLPAAAAVLLPVVLLFTD